MEMEKLIEVKDLRVETEKRKIITKQKIIHNEKKI